MTSVKWPHDAGEAELVAGFLGLTISPTVCLGRLGLAPRLSAGRASRASSAAASGAGAARLVEAVCPSSNGARPVTAFNTLTVAYTRGRVAGSRPMKAANEGAIVAPTDHEACSRFMQSAPLLSSSSQRSTIKILPSTSTAPPAKFSPPTSARTAGSERANGSARPQPDIARDAAVHRSSERGERRFAASPPSSVPIP
eukprot:scaffold16844_cov32-Tisochrysis_lutea.AAC.3